MNKLLGCVVALCLYWLSCAVFSQAAFAQAFLPQTPPPNSLPEGKGRDVVGAACLQCHGGAAFSRWRQGEQAWRYQVYEMVAIGAQISPSEIETVVEYLTTNFGPGINLPPSKPIVLPEGKGKELVEGGCVTCHGLDRVAAVKRAPQEWRKIVSRMIFLGSTLPSDSVEPAVAYLTANFGQSAPSQPKQ